MEEGGGRWEVGGGVVGMIDGWCSVMVCYGLLNVKH